MTFRILAIVTVSFASPLAVAQSPINAANAKAQHHAAAPVAAAKPAGKRKVATAPQFPAAGRLAANGPAATKPTKHHRDPLPAHKARNRHAIEAALIDREPRAAESIELRRGWRRLSSAQRIARLRAEYLLADDELDRDSGQIYWPAMLNEARYVTFRRELNRLFRRSDSDQDIDAAQIQIAVEQMLQELESDRDNISAEQYVAAMKFLLGLEYEPAFYAAESR